VVGGDVRVAPPRVQLLQGLALGLDAFALGRHHLLDLRAPRRLAPGLGRSSVELGASLLDEGEDGHVLRQPRAIELHQPGLLRRGQLGG
jgi:hypothetical protein